MNKTLNWLLGPIILAPGIFLAWAWNKLPATIPVHFNINGEPDRYGSKKELLAMVIILSAVSLFVYLLFLNIHRIDPKRYAKENNGRLQRIGFAVAVFMAAICCLIIYSGFSGASRFDSNLVLGGTGLLFAIIGNYMPNLKPNYFAGFRLPWTLENPENWKKTHAIAGKLWFAGGLLIAVICLFTNSKTAFIIFFAITAVITVIPSIFSYRLFKKQKAINNVQ